jgi:hypothetical protein
MLGASLSAQKKYAEAEPLLLSGYELMVRQNDRSLAVRRYCLEQAGQWIVQLYQKWGKPEKAIEWQERLPVATSSEPPIGNKSLPKRLDR